MLALGLSCGEGFVPLDSELFSSQTKAIELHGPFEDGRGIAGISKPVKADVYPVDWTQLTTAILLLCVLAGCAIPFFVIVNAQGDRKSTRLNSSH